MEGARRPSTITSACPLKPAVITYGPFGKVASTSNGSALGGAMRKCRVQSSSSIQPEEVSGQAQCCIACCACKNKSLAGSNFSLGIVDFISNWFAAIAKEATG